ncbi:MAG TPA: hypothetical protein VJQ45_04815 [Ktedonobacterales bacterium]|nr:hypothetical protein [Ktedonobacterales bacterium]
MVTTIALVAARARQRGVICQAAEQFDASLVFRRARDYCQRVYPEWYVLSTRHGLISPQQVVGPGERPLWTLAADQRAAWAHEVARALDARQTRSAEPLTFALFTSQLCAELLARAAPHCAFELPLSGLSFGERLRWYDERLTTRSRLLVPAGAPRV